MRSGFTRGLVVGGIIGASVMMMKSDMMKPNRKRMMRTGRALLRRHGGIIGNVVDMFR